MYTMHVTLLKLIFIKISMHKSQDSGATLCQIRAGSYVRRMLSFVLILGAPPTHIHYNYF